MEIAAAQSTWGISSGVFLTGYAIIAVAVLVASLRARAALADPGGGAAEPDRERHPHDLAYLNGGDTLAVYSALSAMHLRGTITSERGVVRAVGRLDDRVDGLERAIHQSTASGARLQRLTNYYAVCGELAAIRKRLVAAGLLLSDEQRSRIRRVGLWMVTVAVLGLLRVLAGVAEVRPVGFLTAMLLVVTAIAVVLLVAAPRRTKQGDRTLARLRDEQHDLSPGMRPDWTVYGPEGAALSVGIFGTGAMWASDPAFADGLALQRNANASGGGEGGSFGDSDSGGGGGGGGGGGCGGGCGGGS